MTAPYNAPLGTAPALAHRAGGRAAMVARTPPAQAPSNNSRAISSASHCSSAAANAS
jgi:hypothetical protein